MKNLIQFLIIFAVVIQLQGCDILKSSLMETIGVGSYHVNVRRHTDTKYPPTTEIQVISDTSQLPELYIDLAEIVADQTNNEKVLFAYGPARNEPLDAFNRDQLINKHIIPKRPLFDIWFSCY